MSETFDITLPPFDRLTPEQQHTLINALDVAYFRQGETLLEANQPSEQLHIIIKGSVEESAPDGGEVFAHYTADDMFDVRAQLEHQCRHNYTALEDTLCYLLPKDVFLSLYQGNGQFAAYFDSNLARRQQLLEEAQRQQNLAEFILTKVDDDSIQPCLVLARQTTLDEATRQLKKMGMDAALVEAGDGQPYGIVTRTNLLHALIFDDLPKSVPIGDVATAPVISVDKGDYLFNAMLAMTRSKVKRVSVLDDGEIVGMLDLTQVLSLFSTHSHVLTLRIARANSIEELALAAGSQARLVETLFNNGIHTRFVMELIATVNEQIIEKAFQLTVPQVMQNHCCLVVMGSEGRGEQILKSDQDNALILEDGVEWPALAATMATLIETLHQLGYPLCPGNVMVNNPKWVKSQSEWLQTVDGITGRGNDNDMMDLAILADSHAIAGNKALLSPIKQRLHQQMASQELLLTTFTRPVLRFSVPLTLFGKLKANKDGLDIKQGGIFPIVHGTRALALEHGIEPNNTFERLAQLVEHKVLESSTASNLSEALKLFIKLRLRQQLDHPAGGLQQHLDVGRLNRTDRDLLRHSLHVVKKFKEWLGYHYQIRD
ncbi:cyclic nucleotide-binding/CBS domain-containing protein [Photobacterium sanctipauli]|uniref:Cyclic nucleotide-binding/CBS domain-containing protein n=2 Tax=Photobacterium sanctipauli TaxID=1342794 RepID=A0A2T3NDA6_9GAMM|nr:cyclic nucleotide-binding/CBS domain-containing protein [Photobacterium sanctipauli]